MKVKRSVKTPVSKVQKTEIKYNIQFTAEQKAVKDGVYHKAVTFINGKYGVGKTACACQIALDLLFRRDNNFDKIIISRPLDFSATGYLKGSTEDKVSFHILPIKQNLYTSYGKEKIDNLFTEGTIQMIPIDYMKGITATNAIMIIDEYEDISYKDFRLIITRLGKGSKLIFTGDEEQTSIKDGCIPRIKTLCNTDLVNCHTLTINQREPEVESILNFLENNV